MIGLSNISMLWGLLGLFIPIVIHLLSNRESKEVLFGSTMFLREEETSNPKSIALSDIWLLLMRCLLLSMIVLLMARPYWNQQKLNKQVWIEKEIYQDENYQELLKEYSIDYEQEVFEINGSDSAVMQFPSLWTAIESANSKIDSTDIITFNRARHYLGSAVTMSDHVKLVEVPHINGKETIQIASKTYKVNQYNQIISFTDDYNQGKEKIDIRIRQIERDDELTNLMQLIGYIAEELDLELEYTDSNYDYVIGTPEISVPDDKSAIIWQPSEGPLKIKNSRANTLHIEGAINQNEILTSNISVKLGSHLLRKELKLDSIDQRSLPDKIQRETNLRSTANKEPISAYWWLMILPIFLMERQLSSNTKS